MELAKPARAILPSFANVTDSNSRKATNSYQPIIQLFEDLISSSMSQDYHHDHHQATSAAGIFGTFSNGFYRSQQAEEQQQVHHQQHQLLAQQIRQDQKLKDQGFKPPPPLVAIDEEKTGGGGGLHGYETAGMLSEMFNFTTTSATGLLEHQISANFHHRRGLNPAAADNWYGHNINRQSTIVSDQQKRHGDHQIPTAINASDHSAAAAAAAMQLFLMNPSAAAAAAAAAVRSSPPSPPTNNSTLNMLLPNPDPSPSHSTSNLHQGFHSPGGAYGPNSSNHHQFSWSSHEAGNTTTPHGHDHSMHHHILEGHGQGLSLSLSSSLQHLEAAKAEEFRMGDGNSGMLFFNQEEGSNANTGSGYLSYNKHHQVPLHLQGGVVGGQNHHVGFGSSSVGVVNVLRTSKYAKAAQELLEEFCSVGRGQFKKNKFAKLPPNSSINHNSSNPTGSTSGDGGGGSSSSTKAVASLSAADRIEHQRRKVKLLSMLDEVDRRYNYYCEQMQMVVKSFDLVMGFGAAVPYTVLAQKAMSRHFRCLKDAIAAQLKHSCELLGEKDVGTSGITKGETPRLKLLEQSLRQQRAFHQMGMMEQEAWRPQRGLPDRSVNILRAWLFEHFLHPYPSDADKHLLARQTGLSRNQVSNWFINARVRLWKPMVEEMYQQESKDEAEVERGESCGAEPCNPIINPSANSTTTTTTTTTVPATPKRSEINAQENDHSHLALINNSTQQHCLPPELSQSFHQSDVRRARGGGVVAGDYHTSTSGNDDIGSTLIRFGSSTGDVSLTLGLRHAGNLPEKNGFSVRDFWGI